jgi:C4-dicarboxylate-specific signal transduction histidine kinase
MHRDDEVLWTADGTSFHAELWSYPQLRGDQVVGAVVAFIDITQRKEAEQQAAALRDELVHLARVTTLDALAGSLAHEINQPLTAVMANTEAALRLMAKAAPPLDELRDTLKDIRSDNRRAGDVVQRMRALLKKGATRHEPIEINATVADVVRLIRGDAAARGISIDVELTADLEPIIGDRIQVQQVVLNLLMNACDAVQEQEAGHRRVRLTTVRNANAAVVKVHDRGAGVTEAELGRIFDPFYTTKPDGLGLGLSICRAIVGAHGGTLEAVRHSEGGMTLSATFPFLASMERPHRGVMVSERMRERR